jgi:hypothetical protein
VSIELIAIAFRNSYNLVEARDISAWISRQANAASYPVDTLQSGNNRAHAAVPGLRNTVSSTRLVQAPAEPSSRRCGLAALRGFPSFAGGGVFSDGLRAWSTLVRWFRSRYDRLRAQTGRPRGPAFLQPKDIGPVHILREVAPGCVLTPMGRKQLTCPCRHRPPGFYRPGNWETRELMTVLVTGGAGYIGSHMVRHHCRLAHPRLLSLCNCYKHLTVFDR